MRNVETYNIFAFSGSVALQDEIKFNQAKIPKIHHQARHRRVAKKESKVSMNQIKVWEKTCTKICRRA
jgi:hypothetical protein